MAQAARKRQEKRKQSQARSRRYRERQKLPERDSERDGRVTRDAWRQRLRSVTPVEYALSVMLDPRADPKRRDAMARALLSYVRGGGTLPGKAEPPAPSNGGETPWSVILGGKK
jgi:hypothetical protein